MDAKAQALTNDIAAQLARAFKGDPWYEEPVIAALHGRVLEYTRYMNRVRPDRKPWTVSIWGQLIGRLIGAVEPPDDFWNLCHGNVYKYIGLHGWYQMKKELEEAAVESGVPAPGDLDLPRWLLNKLELKVAQSA